MGASKTKIYSAHEKELANIARAFAHPARIRIMNILMEKPYVRNCDLTKDLKLCKKTVHDHLNKLQDAEILKSEFVMNSLFFSKNEGSEDKIIQFLIEAGRGNT